jgi:ubiquitin-like protein Pup
MSQVQKQKERSSDRTAEPVEQAEVKPSEAAQSASDIIDSLIDEIDAVLEENAEEFVQAFKQEGGQ